MPVRFAILLGLFASAAVAQTAAPAQSPAPAPAAAPSSPPPAAALPSRVQGIENDLPLPPPPSTLGPKTLPFGLQVYEALDKPKGDAPFAYLRDAVNSLGGICTNVTEYQKMTGAPGVLVHKIKCGPRPAYLLTIDQTGKMLLDGGNGAVAPMRPQDGPIIAEGGRNGAAAVKDPFGRVNDQIPVEAVKRDPTAKGKGAIIEPGDPRAWARWLLIGLFFVAVIVGVLMYNRFKYYGRYVPSASAPLRFPSEVKDLMIEESQEIHPDYWQHPTGIIIIRGRHGKRRVFDKKLYAMLYYRWGFKFRQLR
ncbi:MAG: hypothetical protein INF91_05000 [Alphaproteobacteria bacterium]|nr:hypothetical protein [Alphaproteobacteria bacterium]